MPDATPASLSAFDADTAVRPESGVAGPGRWLATLTDRWHIGDKPNGGYVLAIAARAIAGALPEHPHPFTVTAHYLRPSQAGPAEIDVEVVRTGRKMATATASLVQDGKERIRVLATFGDLTEATGPTVLRGNPPEIPAPEDCPSGRDRPGHYIPSSIAERTDMRLHPDTGWVTGRPSGIAEIAAWTRFADGREPDPLSLLFFADALPPAVFEVLEEGTWMPTIELTVHVRALPSPGWLRARMGTRFLVDGYLEEDGELWDSTGRLVAISRQLGMQFRP